MYHAYLYSVDKKITIDFTDGTTHIFEDVPFDQLTTKQNLIDFCTTRINDLDNKQTKQSNLLSSLQSLIGEKII